MEETCPSACKLSRKLRYPVVYGHALTKEGIQTTDAKVVAKSEKLTGSSTLRLLRLLHVSGTTGAIFGAAASARPAVSSGGAGNGCTRPGWWRVAYSFSGSARAERA